MNQPQPLPIDVALAQFNAQYAVPILIVQLLLLAALVMLGYLVVRYIRREVQAWRNDKQLRWLVSRIDSAIHKDNGA